MTLTVPTWLTLLRIVLIPVLVLVFYLPYSWTNFAAAFIFVLAAVTDWLDGWIARRYHLYSAFGAFLDPVADKLMVAVSLFLIVQDNPTMWMAIWAAVIVGREIEALRARDGARLLVVSQPTWGVDVGAAAQIRAAILSLRDAGCAVLLVSEELDELFEMSDRLHVLAKGRLSPSLPRAEATVERVGEWMSGLWDPAAREVDHAAA